MIWKEGNMEKILKQKNKNTIVMWCTRVCQAFIHALMYMHMYTCIQIGYQNVDVSSTLEKQVTISIFFFFKFLEFTGSWLL